MPKKSGGTTNEVAVTKNRGKMIATISNNAKEAVFIVANVNEKQPTKLVDSDPQILSYVGDFRDDFFCDLTPLMRPALLSQVFSCFQMGDKILNRVAFHK